MTDVFGGASLSSDVSAGMSLIETAAKEKLPKGFSYPLGAETISAALEGVPQLGNMRIWFTWRDEFWVSRWRKRLQARGPIELLRVAYSDYFSRWEVSAYSVPSEYTIAAWRQLQAELPMVRARLLGRRPPRSISVTLNLREAEANQAASGKGAITVSPKSERSRRALPEQIR